MGRPARLPFVEIPRDARLFRDENGSLVEVKPCSPHAVFIHARRHGLTTWVRRSAAAFLESHKEIERQ